MFGYLKPFSYALCASALGLFCSQDGTFLFLHEMTEIFQVGNYESKMTQLEKQMTELHEKDQVILNRLTMKKEIVTALYRGDITVEQATSCFHHIMEHGNIKYEMTISGHEGLSLKVRAGLCLMLWIDDPACPNLAHRQDIVQIRKELESAKAGKTDLVLPLPPVEILANHIY